MQLIKLWSGSDYLIFADWLADRGDSRAEGVRRFAINPSGYMTEAGLAIITAFVQFRQQISPMLESIAAEFRRAAANGVGGTAEIGESKSAK